MIDLNPFDKEFVTTAFGRVDDSVHVKVRVILSLQSRNELEELARLSEEKATKDREKLERMIQYGQSAACRWRLLHDYFVRRDGK